MCVYMRACVCVFTYFVVLDRFLHVDPLMEVFFISGELSKDTSLLGKLDVGMKKQREKLLKMAMKVCSSRYLVHSQ